MKALKDYSPEELEKLSDAEVTALYSKEFSDSDVDKMSDDEVVKKYAEQFPEEPEAQGINLRPSLKAMGAQAADVYGFGMTPQVAGAVEKVTGGDYTEGRDKYAEYLQELPDKEPLATMAGTGIGIAASLATPMVGVARLAQGLGRLGSMVKLPQLEKAAPAVYTAGQLLAQNPGETPGEVSPLQLEQRFENLTSVPGMVSMALPVGQGVVAGALPDLASKRAFRALKPSPKKAQYYTSSGQAPFDNKDIGRFALQNDLVSGNPYDIQVKARDMMDEVGAQIGDFYLKMREKLDDVSSKFTNGKMKSYVANSYVPGEEDQEAIKFVSTSLGDAVDKASGVDAVKKYLDYLNETYPEGIDIAKLHKVKVEVANKVKDFEKSKSEMGVIPRAFRELNTYLGRLINSEIGFIEENFGKLKETASVVKQYKQLNDTYAKLAAIEEMAGSSLGRAESAAARSDFKMMDLVNKSLKPTQATQALVLDAQTPRLSTAPAEIMQGVGGYGDPNMLPPIPMMTPQQIDQDPSLSPTQRAKLKNQIYKQPQQ